MKASAASAHMTSFFSDFFPMRMTAVSGVDETQSPENKNRRYDKECAGDDAAPGFVKKPPDVDGELLRFRAGQQHAKVERVQKSRLADPSFPFDQLRLHNRDLAGRSAKADESELQPKAERSSKRWCNLPRWRRSCLLKIHRRCKNE